jgi:hypothetical protein
MWFKPLQIIHQSEYYRMKKNIFIISGFFIITALAAVYINCFNDISALDFYYSFKPDSAGFYFLHGILDSTLMNRDVIVPSYREIFHFFNLDIIVWGPYLLLMRVVALPVAIKLISIFLGIASTITVYVTGRYMYSPKCAIIPAFLYMVFFFSTDIFIGGQLRAFGAFIFTIFLLCFIKKKYKALPIVTMLMTVCYPNISVTLAIICIAVFFFWDEKFSRKKGYLILVIISMAMILSIITGFNSIFGVIGSASKSAVDNLSVFSSYKYSQGTDFVMSVSNMKHVLQHFVLNENEYTLQYVYLLRLFLVISLIFLIIRRKSCLILANQIWIMLLASIAGFLVVFFIHPITASRQLVFSLPVFLVFFIAENICAFKKRSIIFILLAFPLIVYLFFGHSYYNASLSQKHYKPFYDYCSVLERDVIIAGFPSSLLVSSVPMYTKRPVFYMDETRDVSLTVLTCDQLKERKNHLLNALYARSVSDILYFTNKYDIDYFLIESRFYEKAFLEDAANHIDLSNTQINGHIKFSNRHFGSALLDIAKRKYDFVLKLGNNDIYFLPVWKITHE